MEEQPPQDASEAARADDQTDATQNTRARLTSSQGQLALQEAPFGFAWSNDGNNELEPIMAEIAVLSKLKELAPGRGSRNVADRLNRLGMKDRGGKEWTAKRVSWLRRVHKL